MSTSKKEILVSNKTSSRTKKKITGKTNIDTSHKKKKKPTKKHKSTIEEKIKDILELVNNHLDNHEAQVDDVVNKLQLLSKNTKLTPAQVATFNDIADKIEIKQKRELERQRTILEEYEKKLIGQTVELSKLLDKSTPEELKDRQDKQIERLQIAGNGINAVLEPHQIKQDNPGCCLLFSQSTNRKALLNDGQQITQGLLQLNTLVEETAKVAGGIAGIVGNKNAVKGAKKAVELKKIINDFTTESTDNKIKKRNSLSL